MNNFKFGAKLGQGAFSVVRGIKFNNNKKYAAKIINNDQTIYDRNPFALIYNELSILLYLKLKKENSDAINCEIIDFGLSSDNYYFMIFPLYKTAIETKKNTENTLRTFYEICKNVQFLHNNQICHFDIKKQNIVNNG